ncbi:MAG: cobalt-precorrin-5B ((1))-methyltransferase [Frankiales bacterium]|nr:cobalt-precorrin-5B ((1))-methyltransferase [Frankiales bacterium]
MSELREPSLPRTAKVRTGPLRPGWTTGTCSSAAARAAALALRDQQPVTDVDVALPSGQRVSFAVADCRFDETSATAVVVKDAGDDPDVTHGAEMTVTVSWADALVLEAGVGVGTVTKPGLGLEVGGPAINPVPREMITQAVREVTDRGLRVVISVPDGEKRAKKTTNARLGILGGISILGTTGIVRPFSTESWRASVVQAVSVMAAQHLDTLVLCTGGRTEAGAMTMLPDLPDVCFVEVGDFTGAALRQAVADGLSKVVFVGMVGKLTKLAGGVLMTHYTKSKVPLDVLADLEPSTAEQVRVANTARHAYEVWDAAGVLRPAGDRLCAQVADVLQRFTEGALSAEVAMVDFTGKRIVAATRPDWVTA